MMFFLFVNIIQHLFYAAGAYTQRSKIFFPFKLLFNEFAFIDPGGLFGADAFYELRQVLRRHHLHHGMHMVFGAVH